MYVYQTDDVALQPATCQAFTHCAATDCHHRPQHRSRLAADLSHLRQLLHQEKQACAAALDGAGLPPGTGAASREQLLETLRCAVAARERERTRNAELVHRLQSLHAEQVDVLDLQQRYAVLQEAHYQQVLPVSLFNSCLMQFFCDCLHLKGL